MSVEDENVVDDKDLLNEKGEHPESVPWSRYVGIKEMLGNREEKFSKAETGLKEQITGLEEKLKTTTSPEELTKVKEELETTKTKLTETSEELNTTKEKTLTEKRGILTKRGIPEDTIKDMSVKELDAALVAAEHIKPGADLGGGGGSGALVGSPQELAQRAYASSNK